jgi:hypothetical protein
VQDLGRGQRHLHPSIGVDDDISVLHFAQVDAGNDPPVRDQDQPIAEKKAKGPLPRFGGDDLFHRVGSRLQVAQVLYFEKHRYRINNDGRGWVGDLLNPFLQRLVGILQRLGHLPDGEKERDPADKEGQQHQHQNNRVQVNLHFHPSHSLRAIVPRPTSERKQRPGR